MTYDPFDRCPRCERDACDGSCCPDCLHATCCCDDAEEHDDESPEACSAALVDRAEVLDERQLLGGREDAAE